MSTRIVEIVRLVTPPILFVAAKNFLKARNKKQQPNLELSHVLALQRAVPELADFEFPITESNASAVLDFYNSYIPLIRDEARGAYVRSILTDLALKKTDLASKAKVAIAALDLADGLPDRARCLANSLKFSAELAQQIQEAEDAYGAKYISGDWKNPSRGASILYYFQSKPELVVGKRVLHIAPEDETREWLKANTNYTVLDGMPDKGTDIAADVVNTPFPDSVFDVIICHRVLEHVLDDIGAMREFYRILKGGGFLNMSVPQAPHRDKTCEWLVQDRSHHDHVRQYGVDLIDRLQSVGFKAELENWLVDRPQEELVSHSSYPLRMYNAHKPR